MKIVSPYKCDECGAAKQEVNHWWMLYSFGILAEKSMTICCWSDKHAEDAGVLHICSQKCAIARLDKWMSEKALLTTE